MGVFQIDATDFQWINGDADDPEDLCLHGNVKAVIGEETFEFDGTVSASALYLLKTLTQDHRAGEDNQMIPCCGFFLIANVDLTEVIISGCPYGIDWTVEHVSDGVKITTESGHVTRVPMPAYKEEVLRFADKVEAYYKKCSPKKLPKDKFDRNGYLAFWNEWHRRYNDAEYGN